MKFSDLKEKQRLQLLKAMHAKGSTSIDMSYQYFTLEEILAMFPVQFKCGTIVEFVIDPNEDDYGFLMPVGVEEAASIGISLSMEIDETLYKVLP